jgi:hypothetical protein
MSSVSMPDDNLDWEDDPYEPSYDAPDAPPRWWLGRFRPRWPRSLLAFSSPGSEDPSGPAKHAASAASLASQLEHAVFGALRQPREPEFFSEPGGFFSELDRRIALISIAGRFAAAIGVAAVVALFFVFLIPASRDHSGQTDGAPSGIIQSMRATLDEPPSTREDTRPGLCELQNILGSPQSQPVMTHAQSETLLQQFMQWREKPAVAKTP